jgi:hypothetical protein
LLSGKPAFRAVYLVTSTSSFAENLRGIEPQPLKGLYIGAIVPEKKSIYSIVYLTNPADFDTYRPIFEKWLTRLVSDIHTYLVYFHRLKIYLITDGSPHV